MRITPFLSLLSLAIRVLAEQYTIELEPDTDVAAFEVLVQGRDAGVLKDFKSRVWYGVLISPDEDNLDTLKNLPGIKGVYGNTSWTTAPCEAGPC